MLNLGRILEIDLSAGRWQFTPFPEELAAKFLAGRGFNVWYLYHHIPRGLDPLSPQNCLLISCGALTGTAAPVSSRLHINALSPQTGLLGSSNIGGGFGARLRAADIQALVIRGRAKQPSFLLIDGDAVKICSAEHLWGLDTWQTQDHLKSQYPNDKLKMLTIGPGAENGVPFGCIMTGRDHAAGRTGMGTVMGSKYLKAVVIKGSRSRSSQPSSRTRPDAFQRYIRLMQTSPHYQGVVAHGGAGYVKWADDLGILSTHNYRDNHFEAAERIDGKHLQKNITRRRGCHRCPIQCKAELKLQNGQFKGMPAIRPEFESMLALGAKCGLSDLETLVYLDNLTTRLGLDTISAGTVISFAMDLYDRGLLTPEDTGGIDLSWGNGKSMETLIRQMAYRKDFGAILSQGVREAARLIGRGAERHAPHVKGLEMAGYHPYNIMGTALGYAVATRGADFNDIYATLEYKWLPAKANQEFGTPEAADMNSIHGKAQMIRRAMSVGVVLDSLGLCKVPALCLICSFDLAHEAELLAAFNGWSLSAAALFTIGERIITLERLFNNRQGATHADDRLPDMFFEKEYNSGRAPSKPQEWMEPMKQEFYRVMGWDAQGIPTQAKLTELDLFSPPEDPKSTA